MIGLSPNPQTNIRSFGEQLILQKAINKHIVALTTETITFGAYDQSKNVNWLDLKFDNNLKNWAFPTSEMRINDQIFLSNETLVVI